MQVIFESRFPSFPDSRLQRLVEQEQSSLTCGLIALVTQSFIKHEWDNLTHEFSAFAVAKDWPDSAPDSLLNLIVLSHLRQDLISLSRDTNFGHLAATIDSLPQALTVEVVEGLLSAFQKRFDTITLTRDDEKQAFQKYGVHSETGSIKLGSGYLTKDISEKLQAQKPRYITVMATDNELTEAKGKIGLYLDAERKEKTVNETLKKCVMGHAKQLWKMGLWHSREAADILEKIVTYQKKNFPLFCERPIGFLAIRVRDYVSLRSKTPLISASGLESFFKDLWKLFEDSVVTFLADSGMLNDEGCLREKVNAEELDGLLRGFREKLPVSLVEQINAKFVAIRDGLKEWMVLFPLDGVKVEIGNQLPELYCVRFLNKQEAQAFLDERVNAVADKRADLSQWEFSNDGGAIVSQVGAVDATRAAQIARGVLSMALDQFLFKYRYGYDNKPKLNNLPAVCVETTTTAVTPQVVPILRLTSSGERFEQELLLRHPNNVEEQREVIERLSGLAEKVTANHSLAQRVTRAIHWYRKGWWSQSAEDRLLYYWISLETLVGSQSQIGGTIKTVVPYRTSLLAPVDIPVDGRVTYQQLRDWTREFVEDVYRLRNEITHGGVFEGPSFERFVDRFSSTVATAIFRVLAVLTLDLPTPDSLEELLTWIWDRNPDDKIAVPIGPIGEVR